MRCRHCGNENPGQHRFCGMCGRALEEAAAPDTAARPDGSAAHRQSDAHREPEPATPAPAYTGGIFNLGAPADKPGSNLEYLLEDDEPRSRKGLVVGVVALLLVAGLGYLRWHNGGLPWLKAGSSGAKNTAQTADSSAGGAGADQSGTPGASSSSPASSPAAPTSDGSPTPTAATTTTPAPTPAPAPAEAPATAPPASGASSPTPSVPGDQASSESKPDSAPAASSPQGGDQPATPAAAGPPDATSPAPAAEAAPVAAVPAPEKPKAKPKPLPPTRPEDSVAMGERYLYGRGVPQDCTRGLRYVKPAADQSNTKAMITMGALYATGHCLSRDLPTAYRFFALALRKDPENGPLKQNAEMVWSQMTVSERQQAIRMTQ